jgi:polyphosphate kinase
MGRNMFKRIEVAFPVRDAALRRRVVEEGLGMCLADNADAWLLGRDGEWRQPPRRGRAPPRSAQTELLARLRAPDEAE